MTFDGAELDHDHELMRNAGFLGDRTMVNGTLDAYVGVQDELVRLRLVNASAARVYAFGFDDGRAFRQIASDGRTPPASWTPAWTSGISASGAATTGST
ncbi:hypothetical protein [Streptomyces xanthophaeus]|uniref:hypothetical protein n=1 Tax=Streptomyces xanthophaeus TaxID=67385 RepID=UPI002648754F|nr:hypothetical protein [Streptomyces xanthophaeus]WKD36175.1 hypothetical protein KO717_32345 [Streptomyces xanthophaeus]